MVGIFELRADFARFALKMREYRSGRRPSLLRSLAETCEHVSRFTHSAESSPATKYKASDPPSRYPYLYPA